MSDDGVGGHRVLVAEDDFLLAMDLAAMLRRAGAHVIGPVSTVRDALDALEQAPDVATLDVQLGDDLSFAVADELAGRGVPFVFATGTVDTIPDAYRDRPSFAKPFADQTILKALTCALRAAEHA